MPKTVLELDEEANRIAELVKADKKFKDKREAIIFIIKEYKKLLKKIDI
jgi:hypothetical protein